MFLQCIFKKNQNRIDGTLVTDKFLCRIFPPKCCVIMCVRARNNAVMDEKAPTSMPSSLESVVVSVVALVVRFSVERVATGELISEDLQA